MAWFLFSDKTKSISTVIGTSLIYFAMGLYFAAGNTGVYLTSYLIYKSNSSMQLNDAIWFLSAAGFSALFLPFGGWIGQRVGVRAVCLFGGLLQSLGVFLTYWALDTTFFLVVLVYGCSFLFSLATCYTTPLVNVCKWHPNRQGLVSGLGAASMAVAPSLFTPLITAFVNPLNLPPNSRGLFDDEQILQRTKLSCIFQACITLSLFLMGTLLTFEAPSSHLVVSKNKLENTHTDHHIPKPNTRDHLEIDLKLENNTTATVINDNNKHFNIEFKFAVKTIEFWLLSFKVLVSELIFIYLLFIYKPYGQTFIQNDYFLSSVGAACSISNTLGRLSMGYIKDKLGYKFTSLPASCATVLFVALLPLSKYLNSELMYASLIVLAVGAVGSQYALVPSAVQDSFGQRFASVNIGFVYMSTVVATVSSALLSQHLTNIVGWQGMIYIIAAFALADFVLTWLMPSNTVKRLAHRHEQFYSSNQKQSSNLHNRLPIVSHIHQQLTTQSIYLKPKKLLAINDTIECPKCSYKLALVAHVNLAFEPDMVKVTNQQG